MAKAKTVTAKDVELNRWCIEMAMRWPVHSSGGYSGAVGGVYPGSPRMETDADVLGRADKIASWVKTSR